MTNKELQSILKQYNNDAVVYINSTNELLDNINNQITAFIQKYGNNFDDNEVNDIYQTQDKSKIYLSFSSESIIVPKVYYFFLKWREIFSYNILNMINNNQSLDDIKNYITNNILCKDIVDMQINYLNELKKYNEK